MLGAHGRAQPQGHTGALRMAPGTALGLPAHPALGTSRCHPASWKYPKLPNPASGDMTGAVHTVARACPQRCLPDKKLSAATCTHPAGSGHRTEGSAPTTMPSATQDPLPNLSPEEAKPGAGRRQPKTTSLTLPNWEGWGEAERVRGRPRASCRRSSPPCWCPCRCPRPRQAR